MPSLICRLEAIYLTYLSPSLWALRFRLMVALKRWVSLNADGHRYRYDGETRYEVVVVDGSLVERKYMNCIRCHKEGLVGEGTYYGDRTANSGD